jgi:integrase
MRLDFPYLVIDQDRHGNERLYVRRHGRKIRIRVPIEDKRAFAEAYGAAIEALESGAPTSQKNLRESAPPNTLGWLVAKYFGSVEFTMLPAKSQITRRGIIEACLAEPVKPKSPDTMKFVPLTLMSGAHIKTLRDRRADKKGAANNRLKYLSSMFNWALEQHPPLLRGNPARDVKSFSYETEGFHTWTADEVTQFEDYHPVGTKPRLAFALMYYLGVRKSDAVLLGRQHMRGGEFKFIPKKTRHKKMQAIQLPVPAELAAIIEAGSCGDLTFLVQANGKPFTSGGFGIWFRKRCHEAGLLKCSAHGLRKARATILAERGATDRQLMAVFGWSTEKEATRYTAAANRKKLAAMALALPEQKEDIDCPTKVSHQKKD